MHVYIHINSEKSKNGQIDEVNDGSCGLQIPNIPKHDVQIMLLIFLTSTTCDERARDICKTELLFECDQKQRTDQQLAGLIDFVRC
jgi:hypothetical protein